MAADELAARKKGRVQELNAFITKKKDLAAANEAHSQLLADKKGKTEVGIEGLPQPPTSHLG
jgi:hypothetical protein